MTIPSRLKNAPQVWISIAWLAFALSDAAKTVRTMRAERMHHNWSLLFTTEAVSWLPWALGSLVIIWLEKRLRGAGVLEWVGHTIAATAIGLLSALWSDWIAVRFQPYAPDFPHWTSRWPEDFYNNVPSTIVLYACVLLMYKVLESRTRIATQQAQVAELNEQIAQAHLNALRSQIEPHFLFNALNAVAGLIREERPADAVDMIVQLSDFLRSSLSNANRQEVPLSDEIEFARRYLTIQRMRFSDRLQIRIDVQDGLQHAAVPSLILQPLVENAVKHGIAMRKEGGSVRVAATTTTGETLDLSIANDGPALPADWETSGNIGVANVRRRLERLYGDACRFDMQNRLGGGVEVTIRLPLRALA
jgi:two-component system LytT family sensor kinase